MSPGDNAIDYLFSAIVVQGVYRAAPAGKVAPQELGFGPNGFAPALGMKGL